jgi:hypothetical protein
MRQVIITTLLLLYGQTSYSQLLATVQMKETVEGICDHQKVYGLYNGFTGQVEPLCSTTKEEMENLLNKNASFLKDNPKFKSKGMVGVYINCEGEPLQWAISVTSKSKELDQQLLETFQTFTDWKPGKLNNEPVDSRELISYEIKKGVIVLK